MLSLIATTCRGIRVQYCSGYSQFLAFDSRWLNRMHQLVNMQFEGGGSCHSQREVVEAQNKPGGNDYEAIVLRSLTLCSQDKACPGGKKATL